jgi:hypothetical protein
MYVSILLSDEERKSKSHSKHENDAGREDSAREDSVDEDENKLVIKEEPESQDEVEEKNVSAASSCDYNLSQFKTDESRFEDSTTYVKEEDDSDEDIPLVCI